MTAGVTIRPYRAGDEQAILETFNLVFREVCGPDYVDRTLAQWRWAYTDNPAGHRIAVAVDDETGTVASHYAGMPMLYDTPWGAERFVHCVDSMTHPEYRKGLKAKSLFVDTCFQFYAQCGHVRDALYYGFPVDAAYRIGKRYLYYDMLRIMDYLIRDRAAAPLPAPAGVTTEVTAELPPDVGALHELCRHEKRCMLRRDYRYLQWRYLHNPQRADYELHAARRQGRLCGLMVLKPDSGLAPDACTIADWLVPEADTEAADALLAAAVRRQHEQQKQRLMTVFPPWSHEYRHLRGRGFEEVESSTWMQRRLIQHSQRDEFTPEFLAEAWWYTLGDSDLA